MPWSKDWARLYIRDSQAGTDLADLAMEVCRLPSTLFRRQPTAPSARPGSSERQLNLSWRRHDIKLQFQLVSDCSDCPLSAPSHGPTKSMRMTSRQEEPKCPGACVILSAVYPGVDIAGRIYEKRRIHVVFFWKTNRRKGRENTGMP